MIKQRLISFIISILAISFVIAGCSESAKLQPLLPDATILAFGDSLTFGTGTSRDRAYPAILQNLIQRKVINAGVPGEISKKALQRLPGLIAQYQPALIILCHGGNDILRKLNIQQTKDNLQQMINLANQHNIQLVIVGVPEFGLFLNASPIYKELAESNKLPIENNALGDILGTNTLKSDHIHPNAKGYQRLAEDILTLLQKAGALEIN